MGLKFEKGQVHLIDDDDRQNKRFNSSAPSLEIPLTKYRNKVHLNQEVEQRILYLKVDKYQEII